MSEPSFPVPPIAQGEETTGRLIVTFRDDATKEGLGVLNKRAKIKPANAADFGEAAMDMAQVDAAGGAVFPTLGVAVVSAVDDDVLGSLMAVEDDADSPILAIEPERIFYAIAADGTLPLAYLRGYRDAVNHLFKAVGPGGPIGGGEIGEDLEAAADFRDDAQSTWGMKATRAISSRFTGRGIRVAVLDTGFDLRHPDFLGRSVTSRSFITGEEVQDRNGHGTHCIGTSCGNRDLNGRRYGVANEAAIFAGKVLSNAGSGPTSSILAGMEWAVTSRCHVISMSLGNLVTTPSTAYENAGRRALQNGSLVIAAAGNHRNRVANPPGLVGQPANSPSIMAVAAVASQLQLADFSCRSGAGSGANVDIAGPGVAVYSSVPMPGRYASFNGTSMATPHVAGIAALWAQARGTRGWELAQLLTSRARRLQLPTVDVGSGLVQAPV